MDIYLGEFEFEEVNGLLKQNSEIWKPKLTQIIIKIQKIPLPTNTDTEWRNSDTSLWELRSNFTHPTPVTVPWKTHCRF
jgi:hypothetical protein